MIKSQKRILIIDDEIDTLRLTGTMLQKQGYQIMASKGGVQALGKAETDQPDLIIVDLMMPEMDGYELTRRLRSNPKTNHIPIIMFTSKAMMDDKKAGFEAGVDDYLTKPIHPTELASRVEVMLLRGAQPRTGDTDELALSHVIGFIGVKGGVGVTTLAVNSAVLIGQRSGDAGPKVTLTELHARAGDISLQLDFKRSSGLSTLLTRTPTDISRTAIEKVLVSHGSGARFLVAPVESSDSMLHISEEQVGRIIQSLARGPDVLLIDLGSRVLDAGVRAALALCTRVVLVLEPNHVAITLAQSLLAQIYQLGISVDRLTVVIVNRAPSAATLKKETMTKLLGHEISVVISPAPEIAFQAAERGKPMVNVQPGSLVSDQMRSLAQLLMPKV